MPSDILDKRTRANACAVGLPEVEADLRISEGREALEALRHGLRTCTMTNRFQLRHCTGQQMLTRGQRVLRQVDVKIHKAKLRYRYVRNALTCLKGHGPWEKELQVLQDDNMRQRNGRLSTTWRMRWWRRRAALGESRRTLSWIWYTTTLDDPSEAELVEALRVEWCKSYARMRRWHEDVVLTEEEMRRTIEYRYWSAFEWIPRAPLRANDVGDELLEGVVAYSREQECHETCYRRNGRAFACCRAYLAREMVAGAAVVVPLKEDSADEGDEEEGQPDYEDEGDDEILE
ncbi:hypothetical protein B0H13DRAFT_1646449 [Mycena leptocephala]|nr:hypothetical protein B0H13DRAFT_1646449 [Mycena leptocephala]